MPESLRDILRTEVKLRRVPTLGVMVDADTSATRRWHSLREALIEAGCEDLPEQPVSGGLILEGRPRLGIWLMPDNLAGGMIEDFLRDLIEAGDPLLPRAQAAVGNIPMDERRFSPAVLSKAELHTWLAWQAEPGSSLGLAITRKYLDLDRGQGGAFVRWLTGLFH